MKKLTGGLGAITASRWSECTKSGLWKFTVARKLKEILLEIQQLTKHNKTKQRIKNQNFKIEIESKRMKAKREPFGGAVPPTRHKDERLTSS